MSCKSGRRFKCWPGQTGAAGPGSLGGAAENGGERFARGGQPLGAGLSSELSFELPVERRLSNPQAEPFEAVVSLPVGARARMPDGTTSIPFVAQ